MLHDALIIGGSFAGLSAANVLGRARRNVMVLDAEAPRNRFSSHAHNMLGHDGKSGREILAQASEQLAAYASVQIQHGMVESLSGESDGFVATLTDGVEVRARRLVLAAGVQDVLPPIEGLEERWGQTVLHCPYCHGFEIGRGRIGVLAANAHAAQHAALISEWGTVTLFANGTLIDTDGRDLLKARGVTIVEGKVASFEGRAPSLDAVGLRDGTLVPVEAMFIPVTTKLTPLATQLGCALEEASAGPIVQVDALKRTSVAGVYAAGDLARGMHSIAFAAADGMMAGVAVHKDLIGL